MTSLHRTLKRVNPDFITPSEIVQDVFPEVSALFEAPQADPYNLGWRQYDLLVDALRNGDIQCQHNNIRNGPCSNIATVRSHDDKFRCKWCDQGFFH